MPPKKSSSATTAAEPRRSTRTRKTTSSSTSSGGGKTKSSSQPSSKPTKSPSTTKKTHGSKHDSPSAPAAHNATATHLPAKNANVTWKAMPGWVQGHVVEILTSDKQVNGKTVKASSDDPRIVLKSHGPSGKIAVHKPAAVWFD